MLQRRVFYCDFPVAPLSQFGGILYPVGYSWSYTSNGWSGNWTGGDPPAYPITSGSWLYSEASITGLNRIPVEVIAGYMLAGATVTGSPPFAIDDAVRAVLVNGSVLLIDDVIQTDVINAAPDEVHRAIYPPDWIPGREYNTRVYQRYPDGWRITEYQHYGEPNQAQVDTVSGAFGNLKYYYNATSPVGLIMPSQHTYRRLEEIERGLRSLQSGPAVKTIISGHVRNRDEAEMQLNSDKRVVFLPGGETGVKVDKTGDTAAVDQMLSEYNQLIGRYWQQVHVVDMTGNVQRPSSTDRKLTLAPMTQYAERARQRVSDVLALYNATWSYERIHTSDVQERIQAIDLLNQLFNMGVIDRARFIEEASKLV